MDETLTIFLRHADALRAKGVTRVKCGDFEADLAPMALASPVTETVVAADQPKKRGLRELMGVSGG